MNRAQRRKSLKEDEALVLKAITLTMDDSSKVNLDIHKVALVDNETGAKLFKVEKA